MNSPKLYIQIIIIFLLTSCRFLPGSALMADTNNEGMSSRSVAGNPPTAPANLHVLLIGDTNDDSVGRSVDVDLTNLTKLVKSIEENTGLTVRQQIFQGGQLGPVEKSYDKIKQALQTLNVGPQDVVIFYYSGHGGRKSDKESKWPSLGVEGQGTRLDRNLDLDWVAETLQQKQPRLWIAIADACNSVIGTLSYTPSRTTESIDNYKKLFLGYQGHIIASSSRAGQYSYGSPVKGGLYTRAWLDSINQELSTATANPNWKDLMQRAEKPIPLLQPNSIQQPQSEVQVTVAPLLPLSPGCQEKGVCPDKPLSLTPPPVSPVIGSCSQNQYSPDPRDPTKECCVDDSGNQVCAKK